MYFWRFSIGILCRQYDGPFAFKNFDPTHNYSGHPYEITFSHHIQHEQLYSADLFTPSRAPGPAVTLAPLYMSPNFLPLSPPTMNINPALLSRPTGPRGPSSIHDCLLSPPHDPLVNIPRLLYPPIPPVAALHSDHAIRPRLPHLEALLSGADEQAFQLACVVVAAEMSVGCQNVGRD